MSLSWLEFEQRQARIDGTRRQNNYSSAPRRSAPHGAARHGARAPIKPYSFLRTSRSALNQRRVVQLAPPLGGRFFCCVLFLFALLMNFPEGKEETGGRDLFSRNIPTTPPFSI